MIWDRVHGAFAPEPLPYFEHSGKKGTYRTFVTLIVMEDKMERDDHDLSTLGCEIKYKVFQKHIQVAGPAFDDWTYLDRNGNEIKGSQLRNAKDGCEIQRILGWEHISCHCLEHNRRFMLRDEKTDEPLPYVYYEIMNEAGMVVKGETDSEGQSQKIHAKNEEKIDINIYSHKTTRQP